MGDVVDLVTAKHMPDTESDLEFVGMDAIAPGTMRVAQTEPFSAMRSAASAFKSGDVLYGRLRPYLNKVWNASFAGACSGELLVLRARTALSAEYLAYILHAKRFVDFTAQVTAGDRPRISFDTLATFELALPPAPTQNRILKLVDQLFSEIDDGETALAHARSDFGKWRKALLKAAVTGELTAEWRDANAPTETGADLLARILNDRSTRWLADPRNKGKRYVEPIGPDVDDLAELPEGWVWTSIGTIFDVFVGSTPPRGDKHLWSGDVPWVSSGEVGFCRIAHTREMIHREALRGSEKRVHPPGTVMLGMIGEGKTRGQAAILDIAAAHNQNCASIRVSETPVLPEYVYTFLRQRYEKTRGDSSGGNQPALNKGRIEDFHFPLAPVSEQRVIVAKIEAAERAWDSEVLEADIAPILRQSILAAALRGELVA